MAVITSGSTEFTKTVKPQYWNKRFVEVLEAQYLLRDLGDPAVIPEGEGKVMRWLLFGNGPTLYAAGGTPNLVEGEDDPEQAELGVTQLDATLGEWGGWFKIANLAERVTVSGTMQQYVDRTAEQAARTLDDILTGVSEDTPNEGLIPGSSSFDAGTASSASSILGVSRKLDEVNARSHPKAGGGARFVAVLSSEAFYDTVGEGDPTFYQIAGAAQDPGIGAKALSGRRIGCYDVELRISTNIKRDTLPSPQDDMGLVFSGNSFGVTSLDNPQADPQIIIKPSSMGGLTSVLNMWGAIGWKANFGFKVFASNRIFVYKSDATGVA